MNKFPDEGVILSRTKKVNFIDILYRKSTWRKLDIHERNYTIIYGWKAFILLLNTNGRII